MTPKQLKKAIEMVGMSQREMARQLDIDERTMRRYCAGHLPIPHVVGLAVELVCDHGVTWPDNRGK